MLKIVWNKMLINVLLNYRSQLIITSVLVSVQFMATLVWVFAAFPTAKTYFPDRDLVSY